MPATPRHLLLGHHPSPPPPPTTTSPPNPHPFHASCPPTHRRPLTCGTCANKSRLVPRRDPSIIGREHLKITRREAAASRAAGQTDRQTDREGERKGPRADVINCPRDEYPITVRLRNGDGAAVAPVINAEFMQRMINSEVQAGV